MKKTMKPIKKFFAFLTVLALCLCFVACEPKDNTDYRFEEVIENLYGRFRIKLEKNRLTDIDDMTKVSVTMTSRVRYDMTLGSFVEENDNEILFCKAVFTDKEGVEHSLDIGTQGASDGLLDVKIRRGEKIRKPFVCPPRKELSEETKFRTQTDVTKSCCFSTLPKEEQTIFIPKCTYSCS